MKTSILTIVVLTVIAHQAEAGSRSSARYSVPTDVADAGGRRATSALYANHGSAGGIGGIGNAAGPQFVARHGYAGQLYDVASLVVSANPTNVNEGATRQLAVRAVLDDATVLNLSASSVVWSPLSGPINSISAGGLVTAANVYEDTLGIVQGAYLNRVATLGLLVRNVGNDNFGIYAGDGVSDAWQVQYFGVGNPNAAPGLDPDADGQNNGYEYVVGSLPNDGSSYFQLRVERVSGQPTQKNLIFSPRVAGRVYTPQYSLDLNSPSFTDLGGTATLDAGPARTVTDLNATETNKFYRIHVVIP